jgi:hypothetical protein
MNDQALLMRVACATDALEKWLQRVHDSQRAQ